MNNTTLNLILAGITKIFHLQTSMNVWKHQAFVVEVLATIPMEHFHATAFPVSSLTQRLPNVKVRLFLALSLLLIGFILTVNRTLMGGCSLSSKACVGYNNQLFSTVLNY